MPLFQNRMLPSRSWTTACALSSASVHLDTSALATSSSFVRSATRLSNITLTTFTAASECRQFLEIALDTWNRDGLRYQTYQEDSRPKRGDGCNSLHQPVKTIDRHPQRYDC